MSLYLGTNLISGSIQNTYTKSQVDSFLSNKSDIDLSNLSSTGKGKLGPTVYVAKGLILNSANTALAGTGIALVKLYQNGQAFIDFYLRITNNSGSNTDFNWGINRDLLINANSNIPQITPTGGMCTYEFGASWGVTYYSLTEYGGTLSASGQFWLPGRVYTTSGSTGAWPSSQMSSEVNIAIRGTCYGTYTP